MPRIRWPSVTTMTSTSACGPVAQHLAAGARGPARTGRARAGGATARRSAGSPRPRSGCRPAAARRARPRRAPSRRGARCGPAASAGRRSASRSSACRCTSPQLRATWVSRLVTACGSRPSSPCSRRSASVNAVPLVRRGSLSSWLGSIGVPLVGRCAAARPWCCVLRARARIRTHEASAQPGEPAPDRGGRSRPPVRVELGDRRPAAARARRRTRRPRRRPRPRAPSGPRRG